MSDERHTQLTHDIDRLRVGLGLWKLLSIIGFAIAVTWGLAMWVSANKNSQQDNEQQIKEARKNSEQSVAQLKTFLVAKLKEQADSINSHNALFFLDLNNKIDRQNDRIQTINERCKILSNTLMRGPYEESYPDGRNGRMILKPATK